MNLVHWSDNFSNDLSQIIKTLINVFPKHEKFLKKRFIDNFQNEKEFVESLASSIILLTGDDLEVYCSDYQWWTEQVFWEEVHFRKKGCYRYNDFETVNQKVYANKDYMTRYMRALLMTSLLWSNHTHSMEYFEENYIPLLIKDFSHLEVGPGHGLHFSKIINNEKCKNAVGWDVSEASTLATIQSLKKLRVYDKNVKILQKNLFESNESDLRFDSIVFSEVLEHLENPEQALSILQQLLKKNGLIFINMPINSPAIDHIFNLPSPEAVLDFVRSSGLVIEKYEFFPATNSTLEYALKNKMNINCVIIARKGN